MRRRGRIGRTTIAAAFIALAVSGLAMSCSDDDVATAPLPLEVETLRSALDPYTSFALAQSAGFNATLTDCMSNGDLGAMGIHFGWPSRFDATLDPVKPEVLIYEPGEGGSLSLVGVEFAVPFTSIPKTGTPPTLFGQQFIPNDVFGLWTLHVWTHRANPSGLFSSWNPRVSC